jgi:TRAP-type C4-dicarboxylate transport system substrate-binding protein
MLSRLRTGRFIWWAAAALLAASAISLAACSGSDSDKAGGADKGEPRVLTMANPVGGTPLAQLSSWAKEVSRLSGGTLAIEFESSWRLGEPRYEAATLEDVKADKVDMAWVGARAFDTVGVKDFQALVAPLLIDSYALEAKVFEEGIPQQMLEGAAELELVGIGVLPGPMRKLLGVSKPFVRPADFAGEVVGLQDSLVADMTLRRLGAIPMPMAASAELGGVDAYEQQLSSIQGNSYDESAEYVTANLNLWPRPLVIVMGKGVFASLTPEQQTILQKASDAAIPKSLAASRVEDDEAVPVLCRRGMNFAAASESDFSELRAALEPVYADLRNDPDTKSYIAAITDLKTEIAASAETSWCPPDSDTGQSASAGAIPEGTYETTVTEADWLEQGLPADTEGVFRMVFEDGELTILDPPDYEIGFRASYNVFRDQIEAQGDPDTVTARWSFDGTRLTFTNVGSCEGSSCTPAGGANPYTVVWGSNPWVRVAAERTPIDGVYEFTTTVEELRATGSPDVVIDNYGQFRWVLDGGRFEMTQKNGASDRWSKGTFVVRADIVEFAVEEFGGFSPNDYHETPGEVYTYTWSLYRDQLTLGPVEEAISPEPFLAKPWTRVD